MLKLSDEFNKIYLFIATGLITVDLPSSELSCTALDTKIVATGLEELDETRRRGIPGLAVRPITASFCKIGVRFNCEFWDVEVDTGTTNEFGDIDAVVDCRTYEKREVPVSTQTVTGVLVLTVFEWIELWATEDGVIRKLGRLIGCVGEWAVGSDWQCFVTGTKWGLDLGLQTTDKLVRGLLFDTTWSGTLGTVLETVETEIFEEIWGTMTTGEFCCDRAFESGRGVVFAEEGELWLLPLFVCVELLWLLLLFVGRASDWDAEVLLLKPLRRNNKYCIHC